MISQEKLSCQQTRTLCGFLKSDSDQMLKRPPVPPFLPLDIGILTLGMLEYQTAPS